MISLKPMDFAANYPQVNNGGMQLATASEGNYPNTGMQNNFMNDLFGGFGQLDNAVGGGMQGNPMQQMMQMFSSMFMMMMQMMGINPQQMMQQGSQSGQNSQAGNSYISPDGSNQTSQLNDPFGNQASAAAKSGNAVAIAYVDAEGKPHAFAGVFGENGSEGIDDTSGIPDSEKDSNGQVKIGESPKGEWGDPHYDIEGQNGKSVKFDHKGKDGHTYNIFEGDNLKVEGKYVPSGNKNAPQVVGEANVKAGNDSLTLNKDGKAKLNGRELGDGTYALQDGTRVDVKGKEVIMSSNESDAKIHLKAEGNCVNIDPEGSFQKLGGIIGEATKMAKSGQAMPGNDYWEKYDLGKAA